MHCAILMSLAAIEAPRSILIGRAEVQVRIFRAAVERDDSALEGNRGHLLTPLRTMQLLASRRAEMLQGIGGTAITGNENRGSSARAWPQCAYFDVRPTPALKQLQGSRLR